MAENKVRYSFDSVGELEEDFRARIQAQPSRQTFIGIKTPISFDSTGKTVFTMHTDIVSNIQDNLRNLLACNHGSRLYMGDFGANLDEIVSLIGTEEGDEIAMKRIKTCTSRYMPFINLVGYEPIRKLSQGGAISKLGFSISYIVNGLSEDTFSMEINLYEAR